MDETRAAQRARLVIEVQAGVIPERPEPEYTKRFVLTEADWAKARASKTTGSEQIAIAELGGQAAGYAALLQAPDMNNWVRTDWVWL